MLCKGVKSQFRARATVKVAPTNHVRATVKVSPTNHVRATVKVSPTNHVGATFTVALARNYDLRPLCKAIVYHRRRLFPYRIASPISLTIESTAHCRVG